MPGPDQQQATQTSVDETEVAAFLAANPDFLVRHAGLIVDAGAQGFEDGEQVVDIRSRMVERLRAEITRLQTQQRALVGAARANQNSAERIHAVTLFLLDATDFEHLVQILTTDLPVLLDIDVSAIVVESSNVTSVSKLLAGVRVVGEGEVARALNGQDVVLEGDINGEEAVFGPGAGLVRSQAYLALGISNDTPPAMLALGSREPGTFHAGQKTDHISFLARIVERCIRSGLHLAPPQ